MKITYDPVAGATYIKLSDTKVVATKEITDQVIIDFDAQHQPVGIELLCYPEPVLFRYGSQDPVYDDAARLSEEENVPIEETEEI